MLSCFNELSVTLNATVVIEIKHIVLKLHFNESTTVFENISICYDFIQYFLLVWNSLVDNILRSKPL